MMTRREALVRTTTLNFKPRSPLARRHGFESSKRILSWKGSRASSPPTKRILRPSPRPGEIPTSSLPTCLRSSHLSQAWKNRVIFRSRIDGGRSEIGRGMRQRRFGKERTTPARRGWLLFRTRRPLSRRRILRLPFHLSPLPLHVDDFAPSLLQPLRLHSLRTAPSPAP